MNESDSPFYFGKSVTDEIFVNRKEEIERLRNNFSSGINTMLISPRRWGKTSLVRETARTLSRKDKRFRFCFLDMFYIRSEEEFYRALADKAINAAFSDAEELLRSAKNFFKSIVPKVSFDLDPQRQISLSFDWQEVKKHREEILNLPEEIARKKGVRLIVCVDEFQSLHKFSEPDHFQKSLRAVWQHHRHAAYCLYGSKRHMMLDIFNKKNKPFYRFGDMIFLGKIEREHWVEFISSAFARTGKKITVTLAEEITDAMQCHSYYVQQLSHIVWTKTQKTVKPETVKAAVDDLLAHNEMFYQKEIEDMSVTQINFLQAVTAGVQQFTSIDAMQKYHLGTPRNVAKNKISLEREDIIDVSPTGIAFLDPAFELWFKRIYLKK